MKGVGFVKEREREIAISIESSGLGGISKIFCHVIDPCPRFSLATLRLFTFAFRSFVFPLCVVCNFFAVNCSL